MRIILIVLLISLSGCTGIGVVSTSNPDIKLIQAQAMVEQGRPLIADRLINQALEIYKTQNNTLGMAEAYHAYGNLYREKPAGYGKTLYDLDKSSDSYQNAKKLFDKEKSEIGVIKSLVGIGLNYAVKKDYKNACKSFNIALSKYKIGKQIGTITKEPTLLIKGYKNMGAIIEQYIKQANCT